MAGGMCESRGLRTQVTVARSQAASAAWASCPGARVRIHCVAAAFHNRSLVCRFAPSSSQITPFRKRSRHASQTVITPWSIPHSSSRRSSSTGESPAPIGF